MNNLFKNKKFQIVFLSSIIGTLFIGTIPAESGASLIEDVSTGVFTSKLGTPIVSLSPIGQSFIPSEDNLARITVGLFDNDPDFPRSISATAILHDGDDIMGPVLGTSDATPFMTNGINGAPYGIDLDFPTPVSLVPGQSYTIELTVSLSDPVIL